ncbi:MULTISPECIES: hypothetical protein [unclassified Microbacterium]|uniref:hypothetical protein n=1 Tax=unclassified Microbacterium TaxID=2609290 RepID=UPI00109D2C66|nr:MULTISPECIES: hypothetical protein [unclassified Microbacterium]
MSVEQRVKISCDNFDCDATVHSGRGLTDARTMTGRAGWVNTLHHIGPEMTVILQDFCPEHREQAFDWQTYWAGVNERRAPLQATKDVGPAGTISWAEHLAVWEAYARRHGRAQSAERIAERGGFGQGEVQTLLGRTARTFDPDPWVPMKQEGTE